MNRSVTFPLALLGALFCVSPAHGQARGGFASAHAGRMGGAVSGRRGARASLVRSRRSRRFAGGSDFWPYYYSDYDSEAGIGEAPPPETAERPAEPVPAAPTPRPGLVIELQGDHWVQLTNYAGLQTSGQSTQPGLERASNPPSPPANPHRAQAAEPAEALPPAVLVFRDGHKEEIGKYVIVGETIYASSDYWSNGLWTRKVQIADLDVPATLKLNQERGAKFTLPSRPNEVMMRP
jgi:hypothetical protein